MCVKPVTRAKHIPTSSLGQFYEATFAKELATCAAGYNLVFMWYCDWDCLKQQRKDIQACLTDYPVVILFNHREAFFGGRTNTVVPYATADKNKGEEIRCVDVPFCTHRSTSILATQSGTPISRPAWKARTCPRTPAWPKWTSSHHVSYTIPCCH